MSSLAEQFEATGTCVLVPTYNNAKTLGPLLDEILKITSRVVVVNDGSTDETASILVRYSSLELVEYTQNQGKGWALRQGFERALELGYKNAITIDSDGQHFPSDFKPFLDKVAQLPGSLIIGRRNMAQAGIPGKSSFGNKFSNFWYWVETGQTLLDTQCGFRLYPIRLLQDLRFFTRKFEFEIEVIVRAAWRGIVVTHVPIQVHYEPPARRVSHFRPLRDFSRISVLNTVLVTIALMWIKPRDFFRRLVNPETRKKVVAEILNAHDSPAKKAFSIGFGFFMGIVPIWGFQLITAIALAVYFKMNKALVILTANISLPPVIPFILFFSHQCGKIWMGAQAVDLTFDKSLSLETFSDSLTQYFSGAVTLALLVGVGSALLSYIFMKLFSRKAD